MQLERLSEFESELQPWQGRVLTVKHHSRKYYAARLKPRNLSAA